MPRRQFVADLQAAQADLPIGIRSIQPGEDDGHIVSEHDVNGTLVTVTSMIPDLGEYPKSHQYYIFCGDDVPAHIAAELQDIGGTDHKTVIEVLEIISKRLSRRSFDSDGDVDMPDSQADFEDEDEEQDPWTGDGDVYGSDDDFMIGVPPAALPTPATSTTNLPFLPTSSAFRQRIHTDLRQCKQAGLKIGHLGNLMDGLNCYVTVSVRVTKLGISNEALQAWQMDPKDYLILIIQYPNGYRTNEELQSYDALRLKPNLAMRVVAGQRYKPSLQDAIKAFTTVSKNDRGSLGGSNGGFYSEGETKSQDGATQDTFISRSLAKVLEDRLVPILRYRSAGMSWAGAEEWYNTIIGAAAGTLDVHSPPAEYFVHEPNNPTHPSIVQADHYRSCSSATPVSFPLLAMQFMLRHFVRCTEFCLNCHRQLNGDLEAIKPYVCDRPLCLFQYMSLGFGQSIEHEVMAQPYVVDLLVSFCYHTASTFKLKDFPVGLGLIVPPLTHGQNSHANPMVNASNIQPPSKEFDSPSSTTDGESGKYPVGYDQTKCEMIFFSKPEGGCPVRTGNWIVMRCKDRDDAEHDLHMRVREVTFYPTISLDQPIGVVPKRVHEEVRSALQENGAPVAVATTRWAPATFSIYNQELDDLSQTDRCTAICRLLDALPSVKEMQQYLAQNRPSDLSRWIERIPPSTLGLLRWIIASNRACIMQNEECELSNGRLKVSNSFRSERLSGMKGYMQFRFAMGAPDKEQRFISEVRKTTERLNLKYPTLFAWHGSPLYNWHSIIREGLHFRTTANGRAYGDGVYHARDVSTSNGYSNRIFNGQDSKKPPPGTWPMSVLRISSAIALSEIVNAPAEFTSQSPYYVVRQLDWIQTRYLFIQVAPADDEVKVGEEKEPLEQFIQDPERKPRGMEGTEIAIPAGAIKQRGRTTAERLDHSPLKKMKTIGGVALPTRVPDVNSEEEDGYTSDATEEADLDILLDDEPEVGNMLPSVGHIKQAAPPVLVTDFEPNKLDFSSLPMMPMPQYANTTTTRRLMSELQTLSRVQASTPPAELGWHIPTSQIENVYQWIVELHSFHTFSPVHPLVKDMERAGVKSIVIEIRFGSQYPFSPPYIRVVKPRFMPFAAGGGGHVVGGGAICMELLTNSGWSGVCSMESVLLQVRMAIGASEPQARLESSTRSTAAGNVYAAQEAAEGYLRACRAHGWAVPEGFKEVAYQSGTGA